MVEIRRVPDPDVCANCCHLGWGTEEGWDRCEKNNVEIYWAAKHHQVCDDHECSPLRDPRGKPHHGVL